jgi:glycosyltransferase involved in cell wall biosynthesis
MIDRTKVVIVNDGCPDPETDRLGRFFREAYPGLVVYLRKENGGLSSARNHGIRFALEAWPSVRAVFPLDADNRLSHHTLQRLWSALRGAGQEVGWAYQDLTFFGLEDAVWRTGISFAVSRLLQENFCDAASLVHRRVFQRGYWFDEAMRSGYEDWEFFLNASLNEGFRGVHVPDTSFLYRRHGHSMLTEARGVHADITSYIRHKHALALRRTTPTYLEHVELPRFALVELDSGSLRYATDPLDRGLPERTVADLFDDVAGWAADDAPKRGYVPPFLVLANRSVLRILSRHRVLPGLLLAAQRAARDQDCAFLELQPAPEPHRLELKRGGAEGRTAMLVVPIRKIIELASEGDNRFSRMLSGELRLNVDRLALEIGSAFVSAEEDTRLWDDVRRDAAGLLENLTPRIAGAKFHAPERLVPGPKQIVLKSHTHAALWRHSRYEPTSLPYCRPPGAHRSADVFFILPWLTLGGVDQCVLNLARELARVRKHRLHLVVTASNRIEAPPEALGSFTTVSFLPPREADRGDALVNALREADVIVNAHSMLGYETLHELKRVSTAHVMSYLHVIDLDKRGLPWGYPLEASRRYANLIDRFLVISRALARVCRNFGVPDQKISLLPNAPTVAPATLRVAMRLARDKSHIVASEKQPLRLLFCGRFDRQKGIDRLELIAQYLEETGVPFELNLVGRAVMRDRSGDLSLPNAHVLPPETDPVRLAAYFAGADIFLLPSRWEGVPLTLLEAMAHGNVVLTSDVGGVREVVRDGETGFLLDSNLSDEDYAMEAARAIVAVARDPGRFRPMREEAVRLSMGLSWRRSAIALGTLVDEVMEARR